MELRHHQQKSPQAANELGKMIHKLRLMGLNDEATSLDKSVQCRELRELIGREIKANIDLAEPLPQRLIELVEQLVQRINECKSEKV